MQGLLDYPRDDGTISAAEVQSLLTGPAVKVSSGLEMIYARATMTGMTDPTVIMADVSDILLKGSSVSYDNTAKIGGTASLVLDPASWEALGNTTLLEQWVAPGSLSFDTTALYWGNPRTRLRPYVVLSAGEVSAKFYLGVYVPGTPQAPMDSPEPIYTVTCYDQTAIFDVPITSAISYPSGQNVKAAIDAIFVQFRIGYNSYLFSNEQFGLKSSSQVTVPVSWSIDSGSTYLDIINALLTMIGFYPLWADCYGTLQLTPWVDPRTAGIGYVLDATDPDQNIIDPTGTWTPDVWKVPNTWIFLQNGLQVAPVEGAGQYTITNNNNGPNSISRQFGRVLFSYHNLDASSQADLVTQGNAIMVQETQYGETFNLPTGPLPLVGHADVVTFTSNNIPPNMYALVAQTQQRRCNVLSWQLPLDETAMLWSLGTVG